MCVKFSVCKVLHWKVVCTSHMNEIEMAEMTPACTYRNVLMDQDRVLPVLALKLVTSQLMLCKHS